MSRTLEISVAGNLQESENSSIDGNGNSSTHVSSTETEVAVTSTGSGSGTPVDYLSNPNISLTYNLRSQIGVSITSSNNSVERNENEIVEPMELELNDESTNGARKRPRKQSTPQQKVFKEIENLQNTTDLLIPRAPFQRYDNN